MPENEEAKLNPQIVDAEIGIRSLRKIKVYPLSMSDQLKLTDIVMKSVAEQLAQGGADLAIATFVLRLIQDNIVKILGMVTDEAEDIVSEISNVQAVDLATILFDINYGAVAKNFKSLSDKMTGLFQMGSSQTERPLPPSANDTDIDLKTSTESPTETVE